MQLGTASSARTEIAQVAPASVTQSALQSAEPLTLPEMVSRQAALTPNAIAVVCGARVLTYDELERAADRLAGCLLQRHLAPNTRVAVLLERSVDLVVALLAVMKAGSAYIPLDPDYPRERLAFVLKNARPTAIITRARTIALDDEEIQTIVLDDPASDPAFMMADNEVVNAATADSGAYVIYTSGSTGVPKGVRIAQRSVTNFLKCMSVEPGLTSNDTILSVTTVSFDIHVLELFLPLIVGAKVVVARETETADATALIELMKRHDVSVLQATPITWRLLVAAGWRDPRLKMLCGGEALTRKLANELLERGGELWNMYGPTETTVWSSVLRITESDGPVLIGPPIANTQFFVLDEHFGPVAEGEPGELFIGGAGVAMGYVDLPHANSERFLPNPFKDGDAGASERLYRTGDVVRWKTHDGCLGLEFMGRLDNQVKIRGFRIELGEIEATLLKHSAVTEAIAVVGDADREEPAVWAYVVLRNSNETLTPELRAELKLQLNRSLPVYMHPAKVVALSRLPQTANGKVDRKALPRPAEERADSAGAGPSVGGPQDLGRRLSEIWSSLLNIQALDPSANFFLLGGQSMLAMQLLDRIERTFGVKLTIGALFGAPTLAEQVQLLQRWDDRQYDFRTIVQLHHDGDEQPLVVIHNTGVYCYHLAQLLGPAQPVNALQLFDPSSRALLPTTVEDIAAEYVQLIRKTQPLAPYRLLGWCVGGVLAYEIACQLRLSGEAVSFVGVVDAWAPGNLERMPRWRAWLADRSYRTQLILTDWNKVRAGQQSFGEFLRKRVIVKRFMNSERRAAEASLMKQFSDRHLSGEHYDRWLAGYLEEVSSRYTPRKYDGEITLFKSSREPSGLFLDPTMGWRPFVREIEAVVLDGDHFTVFRGAGLQQLADYLTTALAPRSVPRST